LLEHPQDLSNDSRNPSSEDEGASTQFGCHISDKQT
jgi:hypothetical protein